MAHYQISQEAQIEHRQAVGRSRDDWVRVYRIPSALDPERTVLYLDFEEGL